MIDVPLPRLYERDIDVLLQEELIYSDSVRRLVADALGLTSPLNVQHCQLSVVDETGETDVLASFSIENNRRGILLIENKIDAAFQPRQPERYRERAHSLASHDDLELVFCVLIAPNEYVRAEREDFKHFDAVITYEDLAKAIAQDGTPRSVYRAAIVTRALEHARNAYVMVPSEIVGDFWQRVHEIATSEFPALRMPAPSTKGSRSRWIIFKANLPAKTTIDWKIPKGIVDLSFWKGAKSRPADYIDLSPLGPRASLELLGGTVAIRTPVSPAPRDWTHLSDENIREALTAATALLDFYQRSRSNFV